MTTRMELELSRESKTYFPEQYLEGKVVVYVTGEVKIDSILLCISGMATVLKDDKPQHIKRLLYFDKVASLFTYQEDRGKLFPEGKNIFPFRFRLPKGLPSSLESAGGNVRYWIRALLDEADKPTESALEFFSVNALLNLNQLSRATLPISATEKVSSKRCGCLWHRWVSVHLHLQRRAFVPGECIAANVDIENMTAHPIIMTKLSLIQVEVQSRKEKLNVEVEVPVFIGCVPLKECLHHFEDGSGDQTVPGQDWPLPNYEPCVFGPHDVSVSGDDAPPEFSPCYVSYCTTKDLKESSSSTSEN